MAQWLIEGVTSSNSGGTLSRNNVAAYRGSIKRRRNAGAAWRAKALLCCIITDAVCYYNGAASKSAGNNGMAAAWRSSAEINIILSAAWHDGNQHGINGASTTSWPAWHLARSAWQRSARAITSACIISA